MAAPWERFAAPAKAVGPWTKYAAPATTQAAATDLSWGDVPGEALNNAPGSALELGKAVVQPILHPIETLQSFYDIGKGLVSKVSGAVGAQQDPAQKAKDEASANAVGEFFKNRYGSMDNLKQTLAKDPVGVLADAATVLSGGELAAARIPGVVGKVGRVAGKAARAIDPVLGVGKVGKGVGKVAGALAKPVVGGFRGIKNPEKIAARRVVEDIEKDTGRPAQEAVDRLRGMRNAGLPAVVADTGVAPGQAVGGYTTRELTRNAAKGSTEGNEAMAITAEERARGRPARLANFVHALVPGGADSLAFQERLGKAVETARKPLYDRAYNSPNAQAVWNEGLQQLTVSPLVQRAIQGATRRGANEAAVTGVRPPVNPFIKTADGTLTLQQGVRPTLQFWDHVKRNLDGMWSATKNLEDKRDITRIKQQLTSYLDDLVPEYKDARGLASQFFGADNALEAGRKFVSMKTGKAAEARRALADFTAPERKLFQHGYADELSQQMAEGKLNHLDTPAGRQRAELALGSNGLQRVQTAAKIEKIFSMFEKAATGTAPRINSVMQQLAQGGLAGGGGLLAGVGAAALGAAGTPAYVAAAVTTVLILGARKLSTRINENVMRKVAELLTSGDPDAFQRAVDAVARSPKLTAALQAGEQIARGLTGASRVEAAGKPLEITVTKYNKDQQAPAQQ